MQPTIFIHIGHGKTGTTAIQDLFFLNRKKFLDVGILYPNTGFVSFCNGYEHNAHHLLSNDLSVEYDSSQQEMLSKRFKELRDEIEFVLPKTVFISSELLCYSDSNVPKLFAEVMTGYEVKIIICVRRQDYLITASYLQAIKEGNGYSKLTLDEYMSNFGYVFDFNDRIGPWRNAFGDDSIKPIVLREDKNIDIRDIVIKTIGLNLNLNELETGRRNSSLGFAFLPFFKMLDLYKITGIERYSIIESLENIPGISACQPSNSKEFTELCRDRFKKSNKKFLESFSLDGYEHMCWE